MWSKERVAFGYVSWKLISFRGIERMEFSHLGGELTIIDSK